MKGESIWGSPYVMGGITGFAAGGFAYELRGLSGLLAAVIVITLSKAWYHTGRIASNEEHIQFLKKLQTMGKAPNA